METYFWLLTVKKKIIYRASHYIKALSNTTEMGFIRVFPPDRYVLFEYFVKHSLYLPDNSRPSPKYVKHKFSSLSILLEYL